MPAPDILPRLALVAPELADDAPDRVDLELAAAGLAAHHQILDLFDPVAADAESGQVQQRVAGLLLLGHEVGVNQGIPPFISMWMPNLVILAAGLIFNVLRLKK